MTPGAVEAEGSRLWVDRGVVTEWYVHGPSGLEQGFTVAAPLPSAPETLRLELEVEAIGYDRVAYDDQNLALTRGSRVISVRELFAYDADEHALPSKMGWSEEGLWIDVDVRGARYPVVIDPLWAEEQQLVASDGTDGDSFGTTALAISEDTIVVGKNRFGCGDCDRGIYVYDRDAEGWTQRQKLTSPTADGLSYFAESVALEGDTMVVGDSAALCSDGEFCGVAYVFERSDGVWRLTQRLEASDDPTSSAVFGRNVALSGDLLAIGAPGAGCELLGCGAVYVFRKIADTWVAEEKITLVDGEERDYFGTDVAVSGDTLLTSTGSLRAARSAAYVFVRTPEGWRRQQKLVSPDADVDAVNFATSLALQGDTAIVGAIRDDCALGRECGAAYVFVRSGDTWTQTQRLEADDASDTAWFGSTIAIRGDTAIVGAYRERCARGVDCGAAYVFERTAGAWNQTQKLTASSRGLRARFGRAVALSDETMLVSAPDAACAPDTYCGVVHVLARTPCGNLVLDEGEECDGGACCTAQCTFQPTMVVCREAAGPCDVAETCSGESVECPTDARSSLGQVCRPAADVCDVPEACDGTSVDCPLDGRLVPCSSDSDGGPLDGGMVDGGGATGDSGFDAGVESPLSTGGCGCALLGRRAPGVLEVLGVLGLACFFVRRRRGDA
ncbi:MAG: hypothetical protein H6722_11585 [Sandaracinus sp.]|nr:hypothetical protein [Sandaracinus sp.]MCB9613085.1 hypothetical protein [Sandaracinus sp.]MCB9624634.1 hypothetical protein [Sandaracinus sp.]